MNTYVMERRGDSIVSFLLDDRNRAIEIHVDPMTDGPAVGDIYIGKIDRYLPEIGTAFVRVNETLTGALALSKADAAVITGGPDKLRAGTELMVQISSQAIKTKRPAMETKFSLRGTYCVITYRNKEYGVSRKVPAARREELKGLAQRIGDEQFGCLIRTNAASASDEVITKEADALKARLSEMIRKSAFSQVGACLYKTPAAYLERLHSLHTEDLRSIRTEDPVLTEIVSGFIKEEAPHLAEFFSPYKDSLAGMDKIYSLAREMENALSKTVWMKSGASLVIEPTEALTVIDVNTGKSSAMFKKAERESAFLKTNLEAAAECVRQIRLRNISGIIIIDFINMEKEESYAELITQLKRMLVSDPVKTMYVDRTGLGLVEITRKKIERSLQQAVRENQICTK